MEYTDETVVICNMEPVQTPNGMEVQHNTEVSCVVCLSGIPGRCHNRTADISLFLSNTFQLLCGVGMMPSDPHKDKGPTVWEFAIFWMAVVAVSVAIAWHKGHLITQ